ncbi:MAG TPA: hypothetical protein DEA08_27625 [Planctomycetes bacterium]|nr:hypothetical protein [Planctomycetota bacterium]
MDGKDTTANIARPNRLPRSLPAPEAARAAEARAEEARAEAELERSHPLAAAPERLARRTIESHELEELERLVLDALAADPGLRTRSTISGPQMRLQRRRGRRPEL